MCNETLRFVRAERNSFDSFTARSTMCSYSRRQTIIEQKAKCSVNKMAYTRHHGCSGGGGEVVAAYRRCQLIAAKCAARRDMSLMDFPMEAHFDHRE